MPSVETKYIVKSGSSFIDLSGVFEPRTSTPQAPPTLFRTSSLTDLFLIFEKSIYDDDKINFNTNLKVGLAGVDLSQRFRRLGYIDFRITSQPQPQIINNSTNATFSISTNQATATFQWRKNGSNINGATSSSYTIYSATVSDDGSYDCVATYSGISITSNSVLLKILPYIVTQPTNILGDDLTNVSFTITAGGSQPLYYTWYKDIIVGGPRLGNLSSTQDQHAFQLNLNTKGNNYICLVSGDYGVAYSSLVSASIIPPIVNLFSYNNQLGFNAGDTVQLSTTLDQGTNVSYEWRKDSAVIPGQTQNFYNFVISQSNTGEYYVLASNNGGIDASNVLAIYIIPPTPPIVTASSSQYIYNNGNSVLLTSSLLQGENVSYQWYGPNGLINGATSATYSFSMSSSTYGNYYVRATNSGGSDDSDILSIYMNPLITSNPSSPQTLDAGSTATFSVTAVGSPVLSYQWRKNGSIINGATNSSYTTPVLTSSDDSSTYYCVVQSNFSGQTSATSATATLTVLFAPTIGSVTVNGTTVTTNLQEFQVANGSQFTLAALNVNDGNPNATTVGWYKWDGTAYEEFISSSTSITWDQGDDETAYYRFILINTKGTAQSYEITIITV